MHRVFAWLVPLTLAVGVGSAAADEVKWRTDYNAARKEAQEKNRPLMIDFGTENCMWCKRLDVTTFQDATIVNLLNERFIPLKLDANREVSLAQSLQVSSYPTIVLGSAEGKILNTIVGYKEATEFHSILQRALASSTPPPPPAPPPAPAPSPPSDWMSHDYQEAAKAVATSDYTRASSLLKAIVEDGKDRPVQVKARQMLQDIEQQAAGRLARAKQLEDKAQTTEAMNTLTELIRVYPDSQAAQEATQLMSSLTVKPEVKSGQRTNRARELLAQAREDYRTQQYLCCLDRCELLAANYGDLSEGSEAVQLAGEIKNNPEWMKSACDGLCDRLALLYLSLAETWLRKGQPQMATQYLEKVVQTFPGTRQAEAAQLRLAYIKGQTTWQTDFKKP